jgi:hypothetical protein
MHLFQAARKMLESSPTLWTKAVWRHWPLLLGVIAVLWLVHRAQVQSITFDEANTFHAFVQAGHYDLWTPLSNNHVLNTLVMRLLNFLFGMSHLTVRGPALLGGVIYIASSYFLCTVLTREWMLHLPLFVSFIYNPFIMDYLVAARGYGLAIGFLTLAVALAIRTLLRLKATERELIGATAYISGCVGLSFCANYSFGYANVVLLWVFLAKACLRVAYWRSRARLCLAAMMPAAVLVLCIAGPMLLRFPRHELYWGTVSLHETWHYIYRASFNGSSRAYHVVILAALMLAAYVLLLIGHWMSNRSEVPSRLVVAGISASVLCLTLLAHWVQFKLVAIPLPLDRTSLWVMPLLMTFVGSVFSVHPANSGQRFVRGLGVIALSICAALFVRSVRDSYFEEWRKYGADVKSAFPVLVEFSRRTGIHEIPVDWKDVPSFNFYRDLYGITDLAPFKEFKPMPRNRLLYALPREEYQMFIKAEGLEAVYQGPVSRLEILVRNKQENP